MNNKRSFVVSLIVITVALMALAMAFPKLFGFPLPVIMYLVIPSYSLFTFALFNMILKANAKSPQRFVTAFMGAVTLKILVSAAFLLIYAYLFREEKVVISLSVFAIYIVNTWLLIKHLMKEVRTKDTPAN